MYIYTGFQKIKIPKDPKKDQRLGVSEAMVAVEELSGVKYIYIYIIYNRPRTVSWKGTVYTPVGR